MYLDVCPQVFVQVAPSKNLRKTYDLRSLALRSVFDTVLICSFDKLQPIIAQSDLLLFAS